MGSSSRSEARFLRVAPNREDEVERSLEILEPAIALSNGRVSAATLEAGIRRGKCQLFKMLRGELARGRMVTDVFVYETGKRVLRVLAVAADEPGRSGELSFAGEWLHMLELVARAWGCEAVEMSGRAGWGRLLLREGYSSLGYGFEKEVRDGAADDG